MDPRPECGMFQLAVAGTCFLVLVIIAILAII